MYNEHDSPIAGSAHDLFHHKMAQKWDSKYLLRRFAAGLGQMKVLHSCSI